jgi:hypothetical protein
MQSFEGGISFNVATWKTETEKEEKIRKNFRKIGFENGTDSRSCPMADSNISNVESLGSATVV